MGVYDHTARRAAKREPAGFFRWLLPRLDPELMFAGWLDTRTAPPPPESELTCDVLAEFLARGRPEEPWVLVIEFQTEPRSDDLERALEYALRFRRERRPARDKQRKYLVGGVLLNLTGPPQADVLSMPLPGLPEFGLAGRVVRLAVREEDAAATLARVASGELSSCVLPWVVLMRGSGEPATIEEWKRLADLEPNVQVWLDYAVDVLLFAELSDVWGQWKKALEGWNVRVSQQVQEWQNEAELKRLRADLLRVLEKHGNGPVPKDLAEAIQTTEDLNLLSRWFDAALDANSFDEFRAALQQ
ncbi:MAG: hypothetical protein ACRELG_29500 [Gemmataceae bacterium]